jgi:hypothetical protein
MLAQIAALRRGHAVELVSFTASSLGSGVELSWQTASEIRNLGFHLYRSTAEDGPYLKVTSQLIPGLGSSPVGASYSYSDSGLVPGTRYFYKLEDLDSNGKTTLHGPVSALAGVDAVCSSCPPSPPPGDSDSSEPSELPPASASGS